MASAARRATILLFAVLAAMVAVRIASSSGDAPAPQSGPVTPPQLDCGLGPDPAAPAARDAIAGGASRAVRTGDRVAYDQREPVGGAPPVRPQSQGKLRVRAVWADSRECVAGIEVRIHADRERPWPASVSGTTDGAGEVVFELAAGVYGVSTVRGGDAGEHRVRADAVADVALRLRRGYAANVVVQDEWQRPIAGASVWLADRWSDRHGAVVGATDARGRVRIEGIVDRRFVAAFAARFAPSAQYAIGTDEGRECEVRIVLTGEGGALAGRVVDDAGRAVADATVLLTLPRALREARAETGERLPPPPPRLATTGDDGRFAVVGMPFGNCTVEACAAGWAPVAVTADVLPGVSPEVELRLSRPASVRGTVVDVDGAAVRQAAVRWGSETSLAYGRTRTDAEGHYVLDGLPAGAVQLSAAAGDASASAGLVLRSGESVRWDAQLERTLPADAARLEGVVVDASGAAPGELRLLACDATASRGPSRQTTTAADGSFAVTVPWPTVRVLVERRDGPRAFPLLVQDDVRPSDGPVRLVLPDPRAMTGRIAGRVFGPDGRPAVGRLTVWHEGARVWREFATSPDGVLDVADVPIGDVELELRAEGHPWVGLGTRTIVGGAPLDLGVISLAGAGHIEGTFAVPPGIEPGALEFTLYRDHGPEGAVVQQTGSSFASGPLAPAEYELRIQGRRVRTFNRRVVVREGQTSRVDAVLSPAAVRVVQVRLPPDVRAPRWIAVQVRDRTGDLVWSGGLGRPDETSAEVSLGVGAFEVSVFAEGGYEARAPLEVADLAAGAAPTVVTLARRQ